MASTSHARSVTQAQVAREAGVSRGLVSLALAGSQKVAPQTRKHILATARRLGYRANHSAAALASGRSGLLGLVLPDLRNPFFDFIAQAVQHAAKEWGLTAVIVVASGEHEGRDALDRLLSMQVEGLILVSPALSPDEVRELGESLPVCLVGRAGVGGAVDTVRLDEHEAAAVVLDHLHEAGVSDIAYIAPDPDDDPNAVERGGALEDVARVRSAHLVRIRSGAEASSDISRFCTLVRARGGQPGLVAHNDVVALDAVAALRGVGMWCPLVSYDNTFLASREEFSLTSVCQPAEEMARDAVRFVSQRSGREPVEARAGGGRIEAAELPARHVTVPCVLEIRASSTRV